MADLITINSSGLPENVRVVGFRGHEWISRPYRFEIYVVTQVDDGGDDPDLADALGSKAQIVIDRADDKLPPYTFAGILVGIELLHEMDGRSLLRCVMVPRLWELSLSRHSRIFTKMKIPDIISTVLSENGITGDMVEMRLGSYSEEEHVCQYRESDLDFISRWMEREGMYYFFEHTDEGEKLIIADDSSYDEEPLGMPIRYFPQLGKDGSAGASFRTFRSALVSLPGSLRLADYDYSHPAVDVSGKAKVWEGGMMEVNHYGSRFFTPSEGERLAKLRSEEMMARQAVYEAQGTRSHLHAGQVFELENHPRGKFNTKYLPIELTHTCNQAGGDSHFLEIMKLKRDEVYFVELLAIPASTQFRPESRTPWPRIHGYENGIVDGPATSEYAQIDDQGRYKVKMNFDEGVGKDGKASTYVRMMQPHGGGIEGFHFPLRKNTEVVISYMSGDPDRPVISGVVPNALTPSPVTSGNHTLNVIQTGGRNRWELEDKAGQQRITMSTPYANTYLRMGSPNAGHEMILYTDQRGLWRTVDSTDHIVGSWQNIEVGTYQTESIGSYYQMMVGGYLDETVDGYVKETYKSTKDETVSGKVTEKWPTQETTVSGLRKLHVGTLDVDVDNDSTLDIGGNQTINVTGNRELNVTGNRNDVVVGSVTYNISQSYTQNVTANYTQIIMASSSTTVAGGEKKTTGGDQSWIKVGPESEMVLLNKNGAVIGLETALNVGMKLEILVGAKIELLASASFKVGAAAEFDVVPFKCKAIQTKADAISNWVGCHAISLLSGLKII